MNPGRNEPCPCGSGRKFKHCCGSGATPSAPPTGVAHHNAQAALLQRQGRLEEAIGHYRAAIELAPQAAELHFNLGTAVHAQGRVDEAIRCYRKAIALAPGLGVAHNNLGNALATSGRYADALASYARALALDPRNAEARRNLARGYNNLGNADNENGAMDAALASYARALELDDAPEIRANFARALRSVSQVGTDLRSALTRAIREAWTRPADLAPVAIRTLRPADGVSAFDDPLLLAVLESAPVCDVELERSLAVARRKRLDAVEAGSVPGVFDYALARQCFINEHVYALDESELARACFARDRLAAALRAGTPVSPGEVLVVAMYFNLADLPEAKALLAREWPEALRALVVEQVVQPLEERSASSSIPELTTVDDAVSTEVARQYERNPYPRWVRPPAIVPTPSINEFLRRQFPRGDFAPLAHDARVELLVAGCGTGQETVEAARQFPGARILAIDLSRASLAYAQRATRAAGIGTVEYARADLLQIGTLGRTFDVVSSVGVLHHLANPAAGLRALASALRPGGFMRLGLYSELGRRDVVEARALIAARGHAADDAGIRRCRAEVMSEPARFARLFARQDFYTLSACRDLLFHVQEHRFTIPGLRELIAPLGLRFIGFQLDAQVTRRFSEAFGDVADLAAWDAFEARFPDTFAGMYRFWVQRPADR